jgi:acyl-[acyl carrier protein]--UDP-N-acetylglucosamine O-acyltransferase
MSSDGLHKYILGSGPLLQWALACWSEVAPDITLHPLDIGQDHDYRFDLAALAGVAPSGATAFVAWGPQFLNFRRLELMGELKGRGFRMPPLLCRGAIVATSATVGENASVGAGAIVGPGSKIGFNSVVGAGCILGAGVQLGSSVWIADGVQVGAAARIGANASLSRGVILDDGVTVGRQVVLDRPGRRSTPVADKTFITSDFPTAVTIVDGASS